MSTFYTYILACSDGTFYIGKTTDLTRRIRQHNGEIVGGAKYTRGRRPVKLLYSQKFNTLSEALKNEFYLKSLSRNEKEKIITF
jgi:putative endonuclease